MLLYLLKQRLAHQVLFENILKWVKYKLDLLLFDNSLTFPISCLRSKIKTFVISEW